MKGQTYKEQKLAKDCYHCAENIITDPNIIPQWYKKENGRLKEEIFVNKTVSMKVEQEKIIHHSYRIIDHNVITVYTHAHVFQYL
jgi:hypothetical protein